MDVRSVLQGILDGKHGNSRHSYVVQDRALYYEVLHIAENHRMGRTLLVYSSVAEDLHHDTEVRIRGGIHLGHSSFVDSRCLLAILSASVLYGCSRVDGVSCTADPVAKMPRFRRLGEAFDLRTLDSLGLHLCSTGLSQEVHCSAQNAVVALEVDSQMHIVPVPYLLLVPLGAWPPTTSTCWHVSAFEPVEL